MGVTKDNLFFDDPLNDELKEAIQELLATNIDSKSALITYFNVFVAKLLDFQEVLQAFKSKSSLTALSAKTSTFVKFNGFKSLVDLSLFEIYDKIEVILNNQEYLNSLHDNYVNNSDTMREDSKQCFGAIKFCDEVDQLIKEEKQESTSFNNLFKGQ